MNLDEHFSRLSASFRLLLLLLLALPAAADPAAMTATLETLGAEVAADPAAHPTREGASAGAGKTFGEAVPTKTLTVEAGPSNTPSTLTAGEGTDYYFEGKKPLNGITIYSPIKGQGTTAGGESPTDKYGKYGKYAVMGGAALGALGLALGGSALGPLALVAGLLIGAGAVLSFLFGRKKK
jgi:hypothetical protein